MSGRGGSDDENKRDEEVSKVPEGTAWIVEKSARPLSETGNEFHSRGAATEKALDCNVVETLDRVSI